MVGADIMKDTKISTLDISEGMQLSRDVISDNDIFLIPKNTIITKNHILKLELYQISYIYIYDSFDLATKEIPQCELPITQQAEYKKFVEVYNNQVNTLRNNFNKIAKQGCIDYTELNQLATDISSEINNYHNIFSYLYRMKSTDDITYTHSINVSIYANIFSKWLCLSEKDIMNLTLAGILHDIGKIHIPNEVLNKPGRLTDDEYQIMKTHAYLGYKMVSDTGLDNGVKQAILAHHEKLDGCGYPLGMHWDSVHNYAKIISIVDIFDAMTTNRPYRKAYHPLIVIRMFEEECYGILDTGYLYTFLKHIANNYLGEKVLLSTGEEGEIVFINAQSPSRPLIKTANNIYSLLERDDIHICKFL
jgi:putative nucleotidyltransferase with HDIG domain